MLIILFSHSSGAESLFVQSQKVALRADAQMGSAEVIGLVRGDEVRVLETRGMWLKVQSGEKTGWISKYFVSQNRPVGAATLGEEVTASEAKTSRRRESSYSVAASTRGLMPTQRSRTDRESYQSDNKALELVQALQITEAELHDFMKNSEVGR